MAGGEDCHGGTERTEKRNVGRVRVASAQRPVAGGGKTENGLGGEMIAVQQRAFQDGNCMGTHLVPAQPHSVSFYPFERLTIAWASFSISSAFFSRFSERRLVESVLSTSAFSSAASW